MLNQLKVFIESPLIKEGEIFGWTGLLSMAIFLAIIPICKKIGADKCNNYFEEHQWQCLFINIAAYWWVICMGVIALFF